MMYKMVGGSLDGQTREVALGGLIRDYKNSDNEHCRDWYIRVGESEMHIVWTGTMKQWHEQGMESGIRR